MKLFGRALLISFAGNAVSVFPLMLFHRFPLFDAAGILSIIAVGGTLPAMRATWTPGLSLEEKQFLVAKFALLLPVVALAVHAIGWTAVRYQDLKLVLPETSAHWAAVLSAAIALFSWIFYFHRLERKRKNA